MLFEGFSKLKVLLMLLQTMCEKNSVIIATGFKQETEWVSQMFTAWLLGFFALN